MLLLQFLELIVDHFNRWPTDILLAIFVDPPCHQSVERIAAFAYGNGIPLRVLTRFVTLVNPQWRHIHSLQLYTHYHMWKVEVDATHCGQYFSMALGKYCWINGDCHPRDEPVLNGPEPPLDEGTIEEEGEGAMGIALGYNHTPHEEDIVTKLNLIYNEVYELDMLH